MTRSGHLRTALATGVVVLAAAAPATAETVHVTDPAGDFPDIRKLTLSNAQTRVVLKQKYADIAVVQVETLHLRWGKPTYYRIITGNFDDDKALETRFTLVTRDGQQRKSCPGLQRSRSNTTNVATYRVPRACLPRAPDTIRAKGLASITPFDSDQTRLTPKAKRG